MVRLSQLDVQPKGCVMDDEVMTRSVALEAAVADVWAALTEPERLSVWLDGRVRIDLRPGGRGTVTRPDGAVRRVLVEAVEPGCRLALRWWPYEEPGGGSRPGPGSRVEFLLEPVSGGTRLTVWERLPEALLLDDRD